MNDLTEMDEEYQQNDIQKTLSKNHSLITGRITGLLFNDERFAVMPELSLDTTKIELSQFGLKAKDELIPDICVYNSTAVEFIDVEDVSKVADMPLLAIEVLSPQQAMNDIIKKFKAYFAIGIKSCWLVMPAIKSITIYTKLDQYKTFDINDNEIIDKTMDIHLSAQKIFSR
jgi:Uma2 family endonuclease